MFIFLLSHLRFLISSLAQSIVAVLALERDRWRPGKSSPMEFRGEWGELRLHWPRLGASFPSYSTTSCGRADELHQMGPLCFSGLCITVTSAHAPSELCLLPFPSHPGSSYRSLLPTPLGSVLCFILLPNFPHCSLQVHMK